MQNCATFSLPADEHGVKKATDATPGHDAVLSALGPPGPGRTTIVSECAQSTVTAMLIAGVRRLLIVSAAVLFQGEGILFAVLRRTLLRNVAKDHTEMERVVMTSGLNIC